MSFWIASKSIFGVSEYSSALLVLVSCVALGPVVAWDGVFCCSVVFWFGSKGNCCSSYVILGGRFVDVGGFVYFLSGVWLGLYGDT